MSHFFTGLYKFFQTRRTLLFILFFSILLSLVYFASRVQLQESILHMIPRNENSARLAGFLENSKFSDRIILTVSTEGSAQPDLLVSIADSLAEALHKSLSDYIGSLNYVSNDSDASALLEVIDNNLPLFLDDKDYLKIDSLLTNEGIESRLEYNYRTLTGPAGFGMKQFIIRDPLGMNFIGYQKLNNFQIDEQVELYDGHYLDKSLQNIFIFINPKYPSSETERNSEFFSGLDKIIFQFKNNHSGIDFFYFGAPAVAAGNAKQIRTDSQLTLTITIVLLLLILIFFFRRITAPLLVLIPVVFGAVFALAFIFFIQGSISVIAVGAGSLILGIAVNYSLHFLTHYRFHPDPVTVIRELAFPLTAGSLTTIGGFLCLQFVNAPVLQDLGLFAALSLAGAAIATLVFLPHFISKNKVAGIHEKEVKNYLPGFLKTQYVAWLILLVTPVLFYFARGVEFESDMYKINYMSPELREAENKLNKLTSYYQKSVFVITKGNTLDDALTASEKLTPVLQQLKKEGTIITSTSVSDILPSRAEQERRIRKWNAYWNNKDAGDLYNKLVESGKRFQFKAQAFDVFREKTTTSYTLMSPGDEQLLKRVLLNNFIEEKNGEWTLVGMVKTTPEKTGRVYASLSGFPSTISFDRKYVTDQLTAIVNEDFNFITLWTSLLVLAALFIIYGRIELALITFIPMLVSWIWILGIMSLLDIKFNIINIVLSTFIFALGDDYCIFTTDGLQQSYAKNQKRLKSLSVSIALSAITTIIGMGVLIFAKHPALSSIALVSIIGILSVWFISQTLQPIMFRFLITRPASKNHEPFTFWNILKSIFAFSYFITGSLIISVLGVIMMKLIPVKSARKKYFYHFILSKFAGSMIYIMANVKKRIINEQGEDFSKPAIIIANHTSFLDILLLVMLHPKLILITNKWVWNSPVFGLAVRMAEYYPVAEGAENTVPQLSKKVAEGYSIVIFPEGTRSVDGKIGRFHKGAFYLAEQLNLDILPIVIHGAWHTMTKGFFYLKNGQLTVKFLPRVTPGDSSLGAGYKMRAKHFRQYFIEQLSALGEMVETPQYFREQLFSNFLFKGPVLEWYMKIKVRLEGNYKYFVDLLPAKGLILDVGCGYGFLSYMLGYTSPGRTVTGVDYDEDKITIAKNGYDKPGNVNFYNANALQFDFDKQDAIVLNDVLHYLEKNDQDALLEKCAIRLNDHGMLVIREGSSELGRRHLGTRLSELFSTRILGFNKTGNHGLHYISTQLIESVAHRHHLSMTVKDTSRLTSNIIFVLRKQAQ